MTDLDDLLAADAIRLDERASSWEEAVRAAGALLESSGVAEPPTPRRWSTASRRTGPTSWSRPASPSPTRAPPRPCTAPACRGCGWPSPSSSATSPTTPSASWWRWLRPTAATHQKAMAALAGLLGDPRARKRRWTRPRSPEEVHAVLRGDEPRTRRLRRRRPQADEAAPASARRQRRRAADRRSDHILTVCGNGLGTSLFLKNTLEKVLDEWGWGRFVTVEATDTVSARGKAKDADLDPDLRRDRPRPRRRRRADAGSSRTSPAPPRSTGSARDVRRLRKAGPRHGLARRDRTSSSSTRSSACRPS